MAVIAAAGAPTPAGNSLNKKAAQRRGSFIFKSWRD
jgi:hypothetical protein